MVNYLHWFRQVRSMFKLGEYYERDAKAIAGHLKNAGIRVELRTSIDASIETDDVLQGHFSELKVDIKDENLIKNYVHYLETLKKTLQENPSFEDFSERYLTKLFPSLEERRKIIQEMLKDNCSESEDIEEDAKIEKHVVVDTDEQTAGQTNYVVSSDGGEDTSDDKVSDDKVSDNKLPDKLLEVLSDFSGVMRECSEARAFAISVINLNDVEDGIDIGGRLDDPIVAISIDRDDYDRDHPKLKKVLSVFLNKCYDLYVDEFSLLFADMPDGEFIDGYTDENIKLGSLKLLLTDIIENHSSEKMDFQDFEDECCFNVDSGKRVLKVFGYPAAEEIAKVMEKNGLIKIKGDIIRWKK